MYEELDSKAWTQCEIRDPDAADQRGLDLFVVFQFALSGGDLLISVTEK
jgi:hypothetical protein